MGSQTPKTADAFISKILSTRRGYDSLSDVLQPSLEDEAELRRLYATDKSNTRLCDIHVGLVNVFEAPPEIRTTRARLVKSEADLSAKYVFPLSDANRRSDGSPCMVGDIAEFERNWSIFTEGSLSQLTDWSTVVAAGGSVLACLTPLPKSVQASRRSIREFYHTTAYPASDVDLFLWGLTPTQTEAKIKQIYEAVLDSIPCYATCVRTKHTVSIHSQHPYRPIQIVLRLYSSPAEILAGFDVDAPCCAYDGQRVWANPRAIIAMMRQCNTVDMSRRSPSYEARLSKYSSRGFEVYVPTLRRGDIDPTIYEQPIRQTKGLARLLALEGLADTDTPYEFLESRKRMRGGDPKTGSVVDDLQMNNYTSFRIPYGAEWDADGINKLVHQMNLAINSTSHLKNKRRRLHRHPAFFGTAQKCLEDCCGYCPEPINDKEKKLQLEEDKVHIRGRIAGSGPPEYVGKLQSHRCGEWSEQVYKTTEFFAAIAANNRDTIKQMITAGVDVNRRDCVGRTPLHAAIVTNAVDVAVLLIDAGARITARLPNGATPLHLAVRMDQLPVVRKLLQRSAVNAKKVRKGDKAEVDGNDISTTTSGRPSSRDDWSSDDHDDTEMNVDARSGTHRAMTITIKNDR
ncbi:hypothetical protein BD779DRAFT_1671404 [Infundibulicybe gibba]|nr:hypothetical protein BD779DRAFT_1671404 [Infundibulicybe gibba]